MATLLPSVMSLTARLLRQWSRDRTLVIQAGRMAITARLSALVAQSLAVSRSGSWMRTIGAFR